jgi:glycosyltransferase involved in cell wall biosynthesis
MPLSRARAVRSLKVALVSRFPARIDRPRGGVESATVANVVALSRCASIDLHVVTLERGSAERCVERAADWTVHRLAGSRVPQVADAQFGPGRRRLTRYLLDLKPDLVHSHEFYGYGLASLPMPHVLTVHGFDHLNLVAEAARLAWLRAPLWKWVERRGVAQQRCIVSISPYVRKQLEAITDAKICDIENAIDERFFDPSCGEPFECRTRVLCAGWLSARKNTLGAVEAFAVAVGSGVPGELIIAGPVLDPAYEQRVRARIVELDLGDRVKWVGSLDRDALLRELGRTRALLLTSHQENAPMIIAEAMAAGVPVVASNRCGIPFMVREGETGFLIEPDDPSGAGERLAQLLRDPELAETFGARARVDATDRFHPDRAARRTLDLYRSLCPHPA